MSGAANEAQAVILATAGYDHTIRFWEALSGICYRTIQYPDSQVNTLVITPDKRYIAAGGNPQIKLFEVNSSNPNSITSFEGHTGNITSIGFQKECRWMFSGSEDGTIKIWDLRFPPTCQRDYDHKGPVNCVALHPNQGELISGDQNGSIKIWDLTANACTHELVPEEGVPIRSISVAADGTLLVAANNRGNCYIWKMENGRDTTDLKPILKLEAHETHILRCLLSPDVRLLATCSADGSIKIWNTSDFTLEKVLTGHQRWVWDISFSADSAYLVSASSDHVARLWDIAQGETIRTYTGHQKAAVCIALNDTGS